MNRINNHFQYKRRIINKLAVNLQTTYFGNSINYFIPNRTIQYEDVLWQFLHCINA